MFPKGKFWKKTDDSGEPDFERGNIDFTPYHIIRL